MSSALTKEHKAYSDAVMLERAYKKFKKKAPSSRAAAKASHKATTTIDKAQRPDVKSSWIRATADEINNTILRSSKKAVDAAYKSLKAQGKVAVLDDATLPAVLAVASASLFIKSATEQPAAATQEMSRRGMIAMGGAAVLTATVLPTSASASNATLVNGISSGVKAYAASKAPAVVTAASSA